MESHVIPGTILCKGRNDGTQQFYRVELPEGRITKDQRIRWGLISCEQTVEVHLFCRGNLFSVATGTVSPDGEAVYQRILWYHVQIHINRHES